MGSKYTVGQVVNHAKFGYRGVIVEVDETYQGTEEWYEVMARSRPPRDKPWYHVLVHGARHSTYVAERHLEPDGSGEPVKHPEVDRMFDRFIAGYYSNTRELN